jgi:transposase-like protein
MQSKKNYTGKAMIIAEYLNSELSYKQLSAKHNIPARTIQTWVRAHRIKQQNKDLKHVQTSNAAGENSAELQQELQKLKLKNELLEEMLRLSEEMTGIALRKKFGTRQS